jgi:hypothetical protein
MADTGSATLVVLFIVIAGLILSIGGRGLVVADPVGVSDHCPFASSNWPECTYLPLIRR